ncbi:MAG: SRPBCC domain-containing protein [Pyrinomonadaceae bacterium]
MSTAIVTTEFTRELVIDRVFDAPPALVFDAWTQKDHLIRWWGPDNFTLPFCEIDFRVGGEYRYCMRAPDGTDHWVWGTYRAIVPPERIVFTWDRKDPDGTPRSKSVVTVTFAEYLGKTRFRLHQGIFEVIDDCSEHIGGWTECLNRLGQFVLALSGSADK